MLRRSRPQRLLKYLNCLVAVISWESRLVTRREASAEAFSRRAQPPVWRPTSVKTDDFFLRDFNRATTPSTHLSIISIFPHTLSFPILYPSTSIMCFQTIPVLSEPRSKTTRRRQRNPANLRPIATSSSTPLSFSVGLWNCQSAVNKDDFISAFSLQSTLSILGLTETWIRPEDSATPAALSHNLSFSHTPRQVGRGALVCSFQTIGNTQPTLP